MKIKIVSSEDLKDSIRAQDYMEDFMTGLLHSGLRVVEVRRMTPEEMAEEGWESEDSPAVIVFDNGLKIFPSVDVEGNSPGVLFGKHRTKSYLF